MYTIVKVGGQIATKVAEIYGLSTDVANLPTTDIPNGSTFYSMNSGEAYMFDEENKVWIKQDF